MSHPYAQTSQLIIMQYELFYCMSCFNADYVTKLTDQTSRTSTRKKMKKKVLETQGDIGEAGVTAVTLD